MRSSSCTEIDLSQYKYNSVTIFTQRPSYFLWYVLAVFMLGGCSAPKKNVQRMKTLKSEIEQLINEYPKATVGVSVIDLATNQTIDLNGDVRVHAASTMKVPVMIEAFNQIAKGNLRLEDSLMVKNEFRSIVDGSSFAISDDSDDQTYRALGKKKPVYDLIYQMITVSSNIATNILIDHLGAKSVQQTIERLGTTQMQVRRGVEDNKAFERGLNNEATANDLAHLMAKIARGQAVGKHEDRVMNDVLLAQKFNEMIPAGVPEGVKVAHKTGEITAHRHDAAIVYPKKGKPYVLVILIKGIEESEKAYSLGIKISKKVYLALRG